MKKGVYILIVCLSCIMLLAGCKEKDVTQEDVIQESTIPEDVTQEDVIQEDVIQEDPAQEEKVSENEQVGEIEEAEDKLATEVPKGEDKIIFKSLENVFGFADETGKRLITLLQESDDTFADLADYNIAIGNDGDIIEIEYERYQEANDEDNYRQNIYNFDNMAGHIFKAKNGQFIQDSTYFLSKDTIINEKNVIPLIPASFEAVNAETAEKIAVARERAVVDSSLIAETKDGGKICLIVFERIDDDMLASIVYVKDELLLFDDYPATYDENSTWRVDGGDDPGFFELLFLADSDEGLLLGLTWPGPEGESAYILKGVGDEFLETELTCYRYWSPM